MWRMPIESSVRSAPVSVSMQKYGMMSTYPLGGDNLKTTSCLSSGLFFGKIKPTEGVSLMQDPMTIRSYKYFITRLMS